MKLYEINRHRTASPGYYQTLVLIQLLLTGVVVEGREDEAVVFAVNIEDGVDVNFGVVTGVAAALFDRRQTTGTDMRLQQSFQLAEAVGDPGDQLRKG